MLSFTQSTIIVAALGIPAAYLAIHWSAFPETVPMHFGPSGKPDGWGPRWTLVLLPVIGVVVVSMLTIGKRFPSHFNYPVRVTDENVTHQRALAVGLLDQLRLVVAVMLAYISLQQMRTALGLTDGLGVWFLLVFVIAMLGSLATYFTRAIRAR